MDTHSNKNGLAYLDYLLPGGMLVLSYLLLYYLPQDESWKFWIVFGLSVLVFCVGYFGFLRALPEPETQTGSVIRNVILTILGTGMFLFGLHYVYIDNGSSRSLAAATLLLIESMVMCGAVSSGDQGIGKLQGVLFKVLIVGMTLAGIWFFVQEIISETETGYGRIEVATMLWIAAAAWWYSLPGSAESKGKKKKKQK